MRYLPNFSLTRIISILALWAGCYQGVLAQSPVELRQDLANLMAWLPGEYDNEPQVFLAEGLGPPPDGLHPRRHSLFIAIDAPHLGERVFFWEERDGGKQGAIVRQRVLMVEAHEDELALVMTMYPVAKDAVIDTASATAATWSSLAIDRDHMISECPLYWRRDINQLRGIFNKLCNVTPPGRTEPVTVDVSWALSADQLWINDQARDHQGRLFTGRQDGFPVKYYQVRRFECYVAIELGEDQRFVENPFFLHDRGDEATFETGGDNPATARVLLRRSMWPSRSGRNFVELLRISLYFDDAEEPAGIGWATPASGRVGFGTGQAQARCKLAPKG